MKETMKFYDSVHMPEALEDRILHAQPAPKPKFRPAAALAVALALVLMLGFTPTVRAAVDDWIITTFPGLDLTIYEKPLIGGSGGTGQIIAVDTEQTTFAEIRDGRLFFTGNGEDMDITDQITEKEPFYYVYSQDDYEITLVVGYDGTIENFGTHEFIKENGQWVTGTGRNYLDMETETAYPWLISVWETMNVPWPMPGKDIEADIVINDAP